MKIEPHENARFLMQKAGVSFLWQGSCRNNNPLFGNPAFRLSDGPATLRNQVALIMLLSERI
jgi:hypothetical protein